MSSEQPWTHTADEAILEELRRQQPEYVPLVANRLGMHLAYVESRCETLAAYGLLESVTNEAVYVVTDQGDSLLDGDLNAAQLTDDDG